MLRTLLFLLTAVILVLWSRAAFSAVDSGDTTHELQSGGYARSYVLHLPPKIDNSTPLPLVLALHGGSGTGAGMGRLTHFSAIADKQHFIVVYPNGYEKRWADGRGTTAPDKLGINDVQFLDEVIDDVAKQTPVDRTRIYATGISNGAMMCQRLAIERSDKYAAIAPVAGTIPEKLKAESEKAGAVAVLEIHGTDDRFVPINGGIVSPGAGGVVLSIADTLAIWRKNDDTKLEPDVTNVPDRDPKDGATATCTHFTARAGGKDVVYYKVNGGGHTWPGSKYSGLGGITGTVCLDFDASEVIWEFFSQQQTKAK